MPVRGKDYHTCHVAHSTGNISNPVPGSCCMGQHPGCLACQQQPATAYSCEPCITHKKGYTHRPWLSIVTISPAYLVPACCSAGASLLISSDVKSSHSSDRGKCGASQCLIASDRAPSCRPCCSKRRNRHGSTGWLSGRGWKQGQALWRWSRSPVELLEETLLRVMRWVAPSTAHECIDTSGVLNCDGAPWASPWR